MYDYDRLCSRRVRLTFTRVAIQQLLTTGDLYLSKFHLLQAIL